MKTASKEKVKIMWRHLIFLILDYCIAFTGYTYIYVKIEKDPFDLKKVHAAAISLVFIYPILAVLVDQSETSSGKKGKYDYQYGKLIFQAKDEYLLT